jgi:hypothetical protein
MDDDDIETEHMVIWTVCAQYFGESSSSSSDESSEGEIALPVKRLSSKNWSNLSGVWRFSVTNFKLP